MRVSLHDLDQASFFFFFFLDIIPRMRKRESYLKIKTSLFYKQYHEASKKTAHKKFANHISDEGYISLLGML